MAGRRASIVPWGLDASKLFTRLAPVLNVQDLAAGE
jgi:hypothetical protein